VSKKVDRTYRSGRCPVWIKVSNPASVGVQRERSERHSHPFHFLIAGFEFLALPRREFWSRHCAAGVPGRLVLIDQHHLEFPR
jgi:hypothetical protein